MTENRQSRESLLLPILIPVWALTVIGAALFLFSRVLLHLSHNAATATAFVTAAGILVVATAAASRKHVTGATLFSFVGGVVGVAMLTSGLALLVGQPEGEAEQAVVLALSAPVNAAQTGFAQTTLTAPAGASFTIAFDNQDTGVQHNVVIATADPATDPGAQILFDGPLVSGPTQVSYAVDPLEVGTYVYYCKVHPTTMKGTLTVTEAAQPGEPAGLTIVASGLAFDTDTVNLPADTETQLTLENKDAGTPHNFAIYSDAGYTTPRFQGEIFPGPASKTYTIPALPAGTYYFRCDVHPNMQGTVIVGGGGAGSTATVTPAASSSMGPGMSMSPGTSMSPGMMGSGSGMMSGGGMMGSGASPSPSSSPSPSAG